MSITNKIKEPETPISKSGSSGISLRAILIGSLLVASVCFIVSYAELVIMRIQIGFLQMPPVVIGLFLFLVLLSKAMKKMGKRFALSAGELMMIYCMMLVAAMTSSRGLMEKLIPLLVTPKYFANPANKWAEIFYPHIKRWMVPFNSPDVDKIAASLHLPTNQIIVTRFFEKLRAGENIPWGAWLFPLVIWSLLALLIIFTFLCLATILRRQWVDNEKLAFPLVQPPLAMLQEDKGGSLFSNKLFWLGFLIPTIVFCFNGFHNWVPNVPAIPLNRLLNEFLVNPPWNQMPMTPIYLSFAAVGFFFMLPSEILFGLWFFFLLSRVQSVAMVALGGQLDGMPMYPCPLMIGYQAAGAYVVLAAYLLYVSRPHLKKVFSAAFFGQKVDDENELMPYKFAVWGLIGCFALALGWCYIAGMSIWVALLELGVFVFIIAIVMARSTAEAGMLMTETSFRPIDLYRMFAPVSTLGPANLTLLAFLDAAFLRDQRGLLLTGFMDGLKISDNANVKRRAFLPVFIVAILLAIIVAGVIQIYLPYTHGGLSMYYYPYQGNNQWGFQDYQPFMTAGTSVAKVSWQAPVFFGVGVIFTIFLTYMRAMFYWWPFHPLGYALCGSWSMIVFWFPCLLAWMLKGLFLRYGGMKLYIKARPWFLGMILGEFSMAILWTIISASTGAPTPEFPWP